MKPDASQTPSPETEEPRRAVLAPEFFTLDDVATYLNVSVPQVYALVRSRELPAIKIGGRGVWRVGRRQLEEYVQRLMAETDEWAKNHPLNPRDRDESNGASP